MKIGHIYFNKPHESHIIYSSIYCLRLLRNSFPDQAKESHFGGMVSDKGDNMHSKALKTKQNEKTQNCKQHKSQQGEAVFFAVRVRSHPPPPLP